jgi:hypothetical protein
MTNQIIKNFNKMIIKSVMYFFYGIYHMFTQNLRTLKLSMLAAIILIDVIMFKSGVLYTHSMFCEIFFISALPIFFIVVGFLSHEFKGKNINFKPQQQTAKYPIINLDNVDKQNNDYQINKVDNKYSAAKALEETVTERQIKNIDGTIETIRETRKIVHLR